MITDDFNKKISFADQVTEVLEETGEKLLRHQGILLSAYYNRRSGVLANHLAGRPFTVRRGASGVNLVIDYLSQIRFLDLKKTAKGKKKKIYEPIYNKPLYGFLFGYAFHRLQLGLLEYLRQNTTAKIESLFIEIPI